MTNFRAHQMNPNYEAVRRYRERHPDRRKASYEKTNAKRRAQTAAAKPWLASERAYAQAHPKEYRAALRWSWRHQPDVVQRLWRERHANWPKHILTSLRYRAKKQGLELTVTEADLVVPEFCPVLGVRLESIHGTCGLANPHGPSVDRFDPNKGYTPDNVRVISYRANRIKCDATVDEMRAILRYMEGR